MDRQVFWFQFVTATAVVAMLIPFGVQQKQHEACAETFEGNNNARIECVIELGYPNRD